MRLTLCVTTYFVVLCLTCVTQSVEGNDNFSVPFPSDLVGRSILRYVSGVRFPIREGVKISQTEITYLPSIARAVAPSFFCNESVVFHINRDSSLVSTTHFPRIDEPISFSNPPSTTIRTCESEQDKRKNVSFPTGPTAEAFQNATKRILRGLKRIRFGDNPFPGVPAPNPTPRPPCGENPEVEPLIGYLRTVAFENKFRLE